jgi:SAM-dependent methyltransferase
MSEFPKNFNDIKKESVIRKDEDVAPGTHKIRYAPQVLETFSELKKDGERVCEIENNFAIWIVDVRDEKPLVDENSSKINTFIEKEQTGDAQNYSPIVFEKHNHAEFKEKIESLFKFSEDGKINFPSVVLVVGQHGGAADALITAKLISKNVIQSLYGKKEDTIESILNEKISDAISYQKENSNSEVDLWIEIDSSMENAFREYFSNQEFQKACVEYLENNNSDLILGFISKCENIEEIFGEFGKNEEEIKKSLYKNIVEILRISKNQYLDFNNAAAWDEQLIKPIVISVPDKNSWKSMSKITGADISMSEIKDGDLEKLVSFATRIKSNLASLRVEALREGKKEFYQSIKDRLSTRSEITAETEKELEILAEIFDEHGGVKKILDVGCGYGRIDLPLLKKGYEIVGLDANQGFLDSARSAAREAGFDYQQAWFDKGDIIDYNAGLGKYDSVIYTWHSILEAFGPGNLLNTLNCAFKSLRKGGVLVFDQPTRENFDMKDGWYGHDQGDGPKYLSYVMSEDEVRFILRVVGFENVKIKKWKTKSSEDYPEGMYKFTISAEKPN